MSWWGLKGIVDSARQEVAERADMERPPTVCPIDGELLDVNARGVRSCPFGNFRWDGGPVIIGQQ